VSVSVQGKVVLVFKPDVPGGRYGMVVSFPAADSRRDNTVSVYISKRKAFAYAKSRLDAVKVTLTIDDPGVCDEPKE
jgi:hypothetical protein